MPLREFSSKYFLGRNYEMDVLRDTASLAGSGDTGSILLLGQAGTGKTELLKHLFNDLFNRDQKAVPFFYAVKTAFSSVEGFADDYLFQFVLQSIAFIKKDALLINNGVYSLEELRDIAAGPELQWVSDIIDGYSRVRENGEPLKAFLYAVSLPSRSYRHTGMPVVVLIDDFHKIRELPVHADGGRDAWTLFENSFTFQYSPHVIAGSESELRNMFFEETSLGEHFEVMKLRELNRNDAWQLFASLCDQYSITFENEVMKYIDVFNGNPFYIRSYIQAARHTGKSLTEEDFWEIYMREITKGKTSEYWTSILKTHVRRFDLRRPALQILYTLSQDNADDVYAGFPDTLSMQREEIDRILHSLRIAGAIDMGFSTLDLTDDAVFTDVIRGLYHKEILRESSCGIREAVTGVKRQLAERSRPSSFNITIPTTPKAEIVAVRSLEQIAGHFNLPPETAGRLQIALVELFTGVLANNGSSGESYQLSFFLKDNIFSIEVITSQTDLVITDENSRQIRPYTDDILVEEVMNGSKITLIKALTEDPARPGN